MSGATPSTFTQQPFARRLKLALYYASRALGLFRMARWLTGHRFKILCYHGFELKDEAGFRPKLFIRPDQFERRLATIRRYGLRVLPLDQAVELMYAGRLPRDVVAITVDDGFHSVHEKAVPLLRRFGYPATVYVTTYYVERPNPVFRLVVQYMFATTARRTLALDGVPWSAPCVLDLSDAVRRQRAALDCMVYGERQDENERVAICERLGRMLGTPYADIVASKAFALMTPDQIGALEGSGVAVQLHTHRHVLPAADRDAVRREIGENRAALRQWVRHDPAHFCYPSGLWDERQWAWLDEMGVKSSTTCLPGLNSRRTPRHALRRFLDGANIDQLEFEAALSGFSDLLRGCSGWWRRSRGVYQESDDDEPETLAGPDVVPAGVAEEAPQAEAA
jgi:peptidoglycan/xylan/chitin deacetylase (PgdA/CDA1 family)